MTALVREWACDADVWTTQRSGIRAWLTVGPDGILHADRRLILADTIQRQTNNVNNAIPANRDNNDDAPHNRAG